MEKIYCFGELLWDMLPGGKMPGGAPMNVAYHLNRLGLPATPITAIGSDDLGNEIKDFLVSKKIDTSLIQQNAQPTGQVLVSLNENQEASYTIQAPAAWDFIELNQKLKTEIETGEFVLIFGSLSCRNSINRNTLNYLANKASLNICDINLRAPFYNKDLVHHLFSIADWIKINHDEIALITSWYRDDLDTEQKQAGFLLHTFPEVDLILITRGANGAAYYDRDSKYSHEGYKVNVVDTIGSGDSFLAMFISKAFDGLDPEECLKYSCAMGSLVASYKGATPTFEIGNEMKKLMNL